MTNLDDRVQELMVTEGLSPDAARERAQLELAVDSPGREGKKPRPSGREKRQARQLSDEEQRRLAERFVWRASDIRVIKKGKGKQQ